jgi:hydroxypyruvate isomerase
MKNTSDRQGKNVSRRHFMGGAMAASVTMGMHGNLFSGDKTGEGKPFKLKYAPSFGMFKEHAGNNPIDQLKFMADQGFRAVFDNGLMNRPITDQDAIVREVARLNMIMGPFVVYADFKVKSFVTRDEEIRKMLKDKTQKAVELANRANVQCLLMVPGRYDQSLEWDYQTANVVENLRILAELCEASSKIIVIEPLNPWDHPGLFLTKIPQAFEICRAVNSPSCKIINDLYHQQITEGNLIPNINRAWNEIASFHLGDTPGRKEPLTGEINYRNIFKHLSEKKYDGVLCMEHGKSLPGKKGEKAVIDAYRACDAF